MFRGISHLALITAMASAAGLAPLAAQVVQDETDLGTIVLSATKTATERARSGVSISVVEREDLEKAGTLRLSDYLSSLPGISVSQTGPMGSQTSLSIRGAAPRYLAVFIDGVRVDDPTDIATAFDFGSLSMSDISRVEVLRGSQSALWGGSAVGGVINITSLGATEDGLRQSVGMEAGRYGTASLRYSLAYRDAKVETAFSLSHQKTDGYSSYDTVPRDGSLEADGYEATRLSFATRYQVTDALSLGLSGFAQKAASDYDTFGMDSTINHQKRREFGGRIFAEVEIGNSTHLFDVTRYRVSRDSIEGASLSNFTGTRLGFGYQGTTELSDAVTLVYGLNTVEEGGQSSALSAGSKNRISGAFGQILWAPREDLDISVSLRRDENSDFGGQTSGRITLAWQANDALTLRANASTGWLPPSLYQKFGDPTWGIGSNLTLSPEESRSMEIGADYRLNDATTLSATLFRIDTDNMIGYCGAWVVPCKTPLPSGATNLYENVPGTTKRQGFELSGETAVSEQLRLGFAYTYTDAHTAEGARLTRVPRHNLNLRLAADFSDSLTGNVTVQHVADRAEEWGVTYGDYTVVNLGLAWKLQEETALTLRLENVFDRDYQIVPDYGTSGRAAYLGLQTTF